MSSKHGLWTGTFGLRLKAYTMRRAWSWRRLPLLRSCAQGSFGSIAEKGTDLKGKRLSSPHRFVYKSIVNVKGMTVIPHMLHPVPINRWIVPPYCSCWIVFTLSHPHLRASRRYQCNTNIVDIHICFMKCRNGWTTKIWLYLFLAWLSSYW